MKTHFGAADLAGLPGMPTTKRSINRLALKNSWPKARATKSGGGWEYPIDCLPAETRAALMLRAGVAPTQAAPARADRNHLWSLYDRKPDALKEKAQYRHRLLLAVETLIAQGSKRLKAIAIVADQAGESSGTFRRWCGLVKGLDRSDWLPALAPRWSGRTATVACSAEAWDFFKADYLRAEAPCAEAVYRRLARAARAHGWTIPSCRTLQRRIEREFSSIGITMARKGQDAAKRRYPAQERDRSVFKALEAVNADGHKFDLFARGEDGTIARPIAVVWQDLYSGKIIACRVGATESAALVRLATADMVERYGIPDRAWMDNGRAFASKWNTGGIANRYRFTVRPEEPQGVLTALGVEVHWTQPFSGQSKPIERAFRDFAEDVSKHPRFAGCYTGNAPDAKPENYGSRAIPIAEFIAILTQEIAAHNARPGRRSAVCDGRSFDEAFAGSYATALPRKATAEQRRLLLLAAEGISVDRTDGSIRLMGNRYHDGSTALMQLAGRKAVVRFDPQRLDQPIHVYALDGRFVATCPRVEKAGFDDVDAARAHQRARNDRLKAERTQLDAERRMSIIEAAELLPPPPEPPALPETKIVRPVFSQIAAARQAAPAMTPEERDEAFSRGVARMRTASGLPDAS